MAAAQMTDNIVNYRPQRFLLQFYDVVLVEVEIQKMSKLLLFLVNLVYSALVGPSFINRFLNQNISAQERV